MTAAAEEPKIAAAMSETASRTTGADRWERLAPLTGVVAVVLWIIGIFVLESGSPDSDAAPAEIVREFDDNFVEIAAGGSLFALGTLLFLWFLGSLRAHLLRAEGEPGRVTAIMFAAGLGKAVFDLGLVGALVAGAIAAEEADAGLTPEAAQALAWGDEAFFIGAEFMAVLLMAAAGLVVLRTRALPVWLGWLALVIALGLLIIPIGWAFLLFGLPLWVLLASVMLYTRIGRLALPPAGAAS